jgi:hypothetical protein
MIVTQRIAIHGPPFGKEKGKSETLKTLYLMKKLLLFLAVALTALAGSGCSATFHAHARHHRPDYVNVRVEHRPHAHKQYRYYRKLAKKNRRYVRRLPERTYGMVPDRPVPPRNPVPPHNPVAPRRPQARR